MKYFVAAALALLAVALGMVGFFGPRGPGATIARTVVRYDVPDVTLVNQDGVKVRLAEYLPADRPVFLTFIYTTCTTLCPILSAAFASVQERLAPHPDAVRLVSVTIDPETDTPAALREYLNRYRAAAGWDALTGSRQNIDSVMKAVDAYMPDKEHHYAVTFVRGAGNGPWVRLQGLVGRRELMEEWAQLTEPTRP